MSSLVELNLYSDLTPSYGSGTEDTGLGVGLYAPNPGFSDWHAYGTPPNGVVECPYGWWVHGSNLFLCLNTTNGLGRGIYRYSVANDGTLTYQSFVALADLGFAASAYFAMNAWDNCAHYDTATGTVIIIAYKSSGTGNTPIVKCWDCEDWPFTSSNHVWSSSLAQSWGSFVSGELAGVATCCRQGGYLYMASNYSGQVITLDDSDGSVDGCWEFYDTYSTDYPFHLVGVDDDGYVYGGSTDSSGGNRSIWKWDVSNLSSWSTSAEVLVNGGHTGYPHSPSYARTNCSLFSTRYKEMPLDESAKALLGWSNKVVWWIRIRNSGYGEWILCVYDPDTGVYTDLPVAQTSVRRSFPNSCAELPPLFVSLNSVPYLFGFSEGTLDIEDANPGGGAQTQFGFIFCPVGPGTVTYTGVVDDAMTPTRMLLTLNTNATNYLGSELYQKHQFAYENVTQGTGISDYRCGVQELSNLNSAVNGKAAWADIDAGDTIKIYHKLESGWPLCSDTSLSANPGAVGDPTSPPVTTADFGPPREVVAILQGTGGDATPSASTPQNRSISKRLYV